MRFDLMRAAFQDELTKIAGELQGQTRIGRRPISVENYLERETTSELTPSEVTEEVVKKTAAIGASSLALLGLGGGAALLGARAHKDWKQGRHNRVMAQISAKQQAMGY